MLDHLGSIGVSWRQGSTESLAAFTLPEDEAPARLERFAERCGLDELAYLATCNRVELIFARSRATPARDLRRQAFELLTGRAAPPGEAERRLRAWEGEGAAEHLFLIAAGLDSACVGETEIVSQVRNAHERALEAGSCGPALELVFEEALRIAARVRGGTRLGEGRVSLAEIAVERLRQRLRRAPGTVALVGVSPMTERAARSLTQAEVPLLIINRTVSKAEKLALQLGAEAMSLAAFCMQPPPVEGVLTATGSEQPVLDGAALERLAASSSSAESPLIVDMAIPPDVDPVACARLGIARIGMDEIVSEAQVNRAARLMEAAPARAQVDEALSKLRDRFVERYYAPLLGTLQRRYQHTAQEGMKRLLKKELKGLAEEERAAIEKWCEVLARRFAHIPCLGLRGLLYSGPDGSIEAFLSGLEPEFADELRAALSGRRPPPEPRL